MPTIDLEPVVMEAVKKHPCPCGENIPGETDYKLMKTKTLEMLPNGGLLAEVILKCLDCKRDCPFSMRIDRMTLTALKHGTMLRDNHEY